MNQFESFDQPELIDIILPNGRTYACVSEIGAHTHHNSDALYVNERGLEEDKRAAIVALVTDGVTGDAEAKQIHTGKFMAEILAQKFSEIFEAQLASEPAPSIPPPQKPLTDESTTTVASILRWLIHSHSPHGDANDRKLFFLKQFYHVVAKKGLNEATNLYLASVGGTLKIEGNNHAIVLPDDATTFPDGTPVEYFYTEVTLDGVRYKMIDWKKLGEKTHLYLKDKTAEEIAAMIFAPNFADDPAFKIICALYRAVDVLCNEFGYQDPALLEGKRLLAATTIAGMIETDDEFINFSVGDSRVGVLTKAGLMKDSMPDAHVFMQRNVLSSYLGLESYDGNISPHYPPAVGIRRIAKSDLPKDAYAVFYTDGLIPEKNSEPDFLDNLSANINSADNYSSADMVTAAIEHAEEGDFYLAGKRKNGDPYQPDDKTMVVIKL